MKGVEATQHEIAGVRKDDRNDEYERILLVGGFNSDRSQWRLTQRECIAAIEGGRWRFYVKLGEQTVWVVVATSPAGQKYLKTELDSEAPVTLLGLPDIPLRSWPV